MQPMIDQMCAANEAGLYFPALVVALTLPDICAALEAENGQTSLKKYVNWLVNHGERDRQDAQLIYGLRCSFLHQGQAFPHKHDVRVAFVAEPFTVHNVTIAIADELVLCLTITEYIHEIADVASRWLQLAEQDVLVQKNLERFARLRPEGLPPAVAGIPVLT